ncbi:MAG: SigB/SigF/SigG family RNA polymerase sigma factor [Actinomycetota bacterium]|nr:SigB/SigF/SigG family RNA polymerase sigma factor [Actinomycetota bacterium]MDD5668310.1 SigB/SigF/SigG family RNA polymerase sigma factor [Actinomycetota bacterium]
MSGDEDRRQERRRRIKELFQALRETGDPCVRDELISLNIHLVEYLARKFCNRGEPLEDLLQVGYIGLIKAIDRYDLDRGVEFSTYATPTIVGELKRYFRDKGWAIRIPRRLQMRDHELNQAVDRLTQELHRAPTLREVADELKASLEEVVEILESSYAANYLSLDNIYTNSQEDHGFCLMDYLGGEDDDFSLAEDRDTLAKLLSVLSEREQKVIYMRFFRGMTQIEIARSLDISQMHVSRLLRKILEKLRGEIEYEEFR